MLRLENATSDSDENKNDQIQDIKASSPNQHVQ